MIASIMRAFCVTLAISLATTSCGEQLAPTSRSATMIERVELMPNLPEPLKIRDWSQVTRDYLELVLDFEREGTHLPLVRRNGDSASMVTFPAYVGGPRDPEAINLLGAIVSGTLNGLDMRNFHSQDWVSLSGNFFSEPEGIYINRYQRDAGAEFWYALFPNVLAWQIDSLYPPDALRTTRARRVADSWYNACVALGGKVEPPALPSFEHTGINLRTMQPIEKGWVEPEAAAGIAWIEYLAWRRFGDERYLTAADWSLKTLTERPVERSPLYEVLLPYGALTAARMNAELGRKYDVRRLVNDCFEPRSRPQARPGWGVIADRWQRGDMHGLVGSATDGGGYAFAMNTFQWAGAHAPIARYDTRYAHDIGKWLLNLTNASRQFYANCHTPEEQSSHAWSSKYDPRSAIAYEGIRKWKRGAAPVVSEQKITSGKVVSGSFQSTQFYRELESAAQVLEEDPAAAVPLEQVWELDLPAVENRWLVVAAQRIDRGHCGNEFCFSYSSSPQGPFTPAFIFVGAEKPQVARLPSVLTGKLYVKAASLPFCPGERRPDRLAVDAISVSYQMPNVGPFAQGDSVVSFVDLLENATAPIVLYRPASAITDLGLYGSSHVGILGGMVKATNVPGILRIDLLKTDYAHAAAYPTYLYYNPYDEAKEIEFAAGTEPCDLYEATTDRILQANIRGTTTLSIPADTARIVVIAPPGAELEHDSQRTLINGVVVHYAN